MINDKALDPRALARGNSSTGLTIWDLFNRPLNSFGDYMPMLRQSLALKTDVKEEADAYILSADLPGVQKEDLKVDFADGILTISAEHHSSKEDKDEKGYLLRERVSGSYSRSFSFEDADESKIDAEFSNGVLTMMIGKKEPQKKATSIAIK